jgi:hypothetical protein
LVVAIEQLSRFGGLLPLLASLLSSIITVWGRDVVADVGREEENGRKKFPANSLRPQTTDVNSD